MCVLRVLISVGQDRERSGTRNWQESQGLPLKGEPSATSCRSADFGIVAITHVFTTTGPVLTRFSAPKAGCKRLNVMKANWAAAVRPVDADKVPTVSCSDVTCGMDTCYVLVCN